MTTTPAITPVNPIAAPVQDGVHSKINLGVWAYLIAASADNASLNAIQASMAEKTTELSKDIALPLSQEQQKELQDYQTRMEAQSAYWQKNGDKDSKGNDNYGRDMLAEANGYNALKSACKNKMDMVTTQIDSLSSTTTALNKEGSSLIASNMQSALTIYSTILDLGNELVG